MYLRRVSQQRTESEQERSLRVSLQHTPEFNNPRCSHHVHATAQLFAEVCEPFAILPTLPGNRIVL